MPGFTKLDGTRRRRAVTKSESMFVAYCEANGIPFKRIPESTVRTPDYAIQLGQVEVVCEVKQLEMSDSEKRAWQDVRNKGVGAHWVQNRLRRRLKNVSGQLRAASSRGTPTMVVVFDNTPFQAELRHEDVVQALYGRLAYPVVVSGDGELALDAPFFGGDRGLTPTQNTSVSAVAVLEKLGEGLSLRTYHNLHAVVGLKPCLLEGLPVRQMVVPGDTTIEV